MATYLTQNLAKLTPHVGRDLWSIVGATFRLPDAGVIRERKQVNKVEESDTYYPLRGQEHSVGVKEELFGTPIGSVGSEILRLSTKGHRVRVGSESF